MGAITLAHDLARHISLETGNVCRRGYVEKEIVDGEKRMVFNRTDIQPGERILMVEDVLTTGSSADLTATAIERSGGVVVPVMAVLFNRSGEHRVRGRSVVSLIDRPLPLFAPHNCPLCRQGSKALAPKHHWPQLTAVY
jgi:orotate phosphoribosyltransferase